MEQLSEQEQIVNQALSKMTWCDCQIVPGDFGSLVLAISDDLTYYHTMEVIFNGVCFSHIKHWFKVNPEAGLFQPMSLTKRYALNQEYHVEVGFRLFQLLDEDNLAHHVAAESISINHDSVLYYNREDLQPGQRIASWVKK